MSQDSRHRAWVFPRVIPQELVRSQLAAMRASVEMQDGKIQSKESHNPNVRRSKVGWIDPTKFEICRIVREHVFKANRDAGWNIWLNDKVEWQLTHYGAGDEGFYKPHMDTLSNPGDEGDDRKLSCVVQLSDRSTYTGGEFNLHYVGGIDQQRVGHEGTIVVFPSFVVHDVLPVTRGERFSLVSWHHGPNWR